ncbi:hypothetical protein EV182_004129, partial [Spiromyces aspiralis]
MPCLRSNTEFKRKDVPIKEMLRYGPFRMADFAMMFAALVGLFLAIINYQLLLSWTTDYSDAAVVPLAVFVDIMALFALMFLVVFMFVEFTKVKMAEIDEEKIAEMNEKELEKNTKLLKAEKRAKYQFFLAGFIYALILTFAVTADWSIRNMEGKKLIDADGVNLLAQILP